jgi:hypothetical protein
VAHVSVIPTKDPRSPTRTGRRPRRRTGVAVHLGAATIAGTGYEAAVTAGVFLYRLYYWFLPIPLAWILLKIARRGRSMLPTTAELKAAARG